MTLEMEVMSFNVQKLSSVIRDEFDSYYLLLDVRDPNREAKAKGLGGLKRFGDNKNLAYVKEEDDAN